jgi:phage tail-like protein
MPGTRAFAAGRFSLQLDGVDCGFVQAVSGGAVTADVVTVLAQGSGFAEKHLGQVRYEEIALQLDLSCDARVYDWIAASLTRQFLRKDGSIVATDAAGKAVSEQAFSDGLVTEVTVLRLDGASKEPCYLTVEVAPETTQLKKGSGKAVKPIAVKKKQQWLASNFKLEIDGLETKGVSSSRSSPPTARRGSAPSPSSTSASSGSRRSRGRPAPRRSRGSSPTSTASGWSWPSPRQPALELIY